MIEKPNRKVMRVSEHGLGISLPANWCRENDIRQGDVIRLEEVMDVSRKNGTGLILRPIKWSDIGECKMPGQSPANGLKMASEGKGRDRA
jgi:hypothetical protein